jgi:hypothetical protein
MIALDKFLFSSGGNSAGSESSESSEIQFYLWGASRARAINMNRGANFLPFKIK